MARTPRKSTRWCEVCRRKGNGTVSVKAAGGRWWLCDRCRPEVGILQRDNSRRTRDGIIREEVTAADRKYVMERDRGLCRYCGARATTIDHILPIWWGGQTKTHNLVAACWPCNREKGAALDTRFTRLLAEQGHGMARKALGIAQAS